MALKKKKKEVGGEYKTIHTLTKRIEGKANDNNNNNNKNNDNSSNSNNKTKSK